MTQKMHKTFCIKMHWNASRVMFTHTAGLDPYRAWAASSTPLNSLASHVSAFGRYQLEHPGHNHMSRKVPPASMRLQPARHDTRVRHDFSNHYVQHCLLDEALAKRKALPHIRQGEDCKQMHGGSQSLFALETDPGPLVPLPSPSQLFPPPVLQGRDMLFESRP